DWSSDVCSSDLSSALPCSAKRVAGGWRFPRTILTALTGQKPIVQQKAHSTPRSMAINPTPDHLIAPTDVGRRSCDKGSTTQHAWRHGSSLSRILARPQSKCGARLHRKPETRPSRMLRG